VDGGGAREEPHYPKRRLADVREDVRDERRDDGERLRRQPRDLVPDLHVCRSLDDHLDLLGTVNVPRVRCPGSTT
jgi:hypothetical protein